MARMGLNVAALLWGFAEATLFFLVPDILLSAAGLTQLRRGLICCLYALVGALAGGLIMYIWGLQNQVLAAHSVERILAISPAMMQQVQDQLARDGLLAILLGPAQGIPYKTYAVQAAGAGIGLVPFLLISVPARLCRFVLVTLCVHYLGRILPGNHRHQAWPLVLCWVLFYLWYFTVMPSH